MYREIQARPELQGIVDTFWTFSGSPHAQAFKVLPDSCVDIIIGLSQGKAFLSGAMTYPHIRELTKEAELIGIRFKMEKWGLLTQVPPTETTNQRLEVSSIMGSLSPSKLGELSELLSLTSQIAFLEKFVCELISKSSKKEDSRILSAVEAIRTSKGRRDIQQLAQMNCISLRQLERCFKQHMGLTMKEFSRIVRFHFTQQLISTSPHLSLLDIAWKMGFYDHAHMHHEFIHMAGDPPGTFR